MPRFEFLHALRGIAALLVVLFHGTLIGRAYFGHELFAGFFLFGSFGVHFFFVLSGFIITYLHVGDFGNRGALAGYFKKRVIRVYPIYWVVTLMILPAYFLFPSFGYGYETNAGSILASLLLIPTREWPILGVAWTLRHEVWFYLLFAVAILGGKRFAIWLFLCTAILSGFFYFSSIGALGFSWKLSHPFNFMLSRYNLEFIAGAVSAIMVRHFVSVRIHLFAVLSGLVILIVTAMTSHSSEADIEVAPWVFAGYAVSAFLLVIGAAWWDRASRLDLGAPLRLLGDASYAIYLIHYPALSLFSKLVSMLFEPESASAVWSAMAAYLAVVMALAAGVLLHVYCEKPMLKTLRAKYLGRNKAVAA